LLQIFHQKDDELLYLTWLREHPDGYVLNSRRKINLEYLPLHRASCAAIRCYKARAQGNAFTGKRYIKICADTKQELRLWLTAQGGEDFSEYCSKCKPYGGFELNELRVNLSAYQDCLETLVQYAASQPSRRKQRLKTANKRPEKQLVTTSIFKRNPDVIAEVRERAGGFCERCGKPAPFLRATDKLPFLEVHHILPLAQGGDDSVENAIAVCPNCHRQAHFG
jgi:5-methylcytosine-specific restriction protein A